MRREHEAFPPGLENCRQSIRPYRLAAATSRRRLRDALHNATIGRGWYPPEGNYVASIRGAKERDSLVDRNLGREDRMAPTLAVVDSRNMFHQAGDVLGHKERPAVEGVIRALALYGFDARKVCVGLALARPSDQAALAKPDQDNRLYRAGVLQHDRGEVLEGELHVKDRGVEEKMVDVACAVCIASHAAEMSRGESDLRAVVVMSQDIDLTPAYRYCEQRKVPLYVAAASVVDKRAYPYLLLGEAALATACPSGEPLVGHALRDAVAQMAKARKRDQWAFLRRTRGLLLMRHTSGVLGVVEPRKASRLRPGDSCEAYAAAVEFRADGASFPLVRLQPDKPTGANDLRTGTVSKRLSPLDVEVTLANGERHRVGAPMGHLVRRTEVLLQVRRGTCRLVGALAPPPVLLAYPGGEAVDTVAPFVVQVLATRGRGLAIAVDEKGRRVTLLTSRNVDLRRDDRYAAVAIDVREKGRERLIVQAISSPLP